MDNVDRQLLCLLCENARYTLKELSERIFLSPPAIASRIDRLEADGLICGYGARLAHEKLGYAITAFISLQIPPSKKQSFMTYIPTVKNVLECNCVTGEYSVLIKAVFATTGELDSLVMQLQEYGHTQTQIVFCTPVPTREISP